MIHRLRAAADTALDYLVMIAVTVAPAFFPRALDRPVTVREQDSAAGNDSNVDLDSPGDRGGDH